VSKAVNTGRYFVQGDEAIAEGAIAAGCRYFAGYPITPASEISESIARRMPEVGGVVMQMEDELASIHSVGGASVAGMKAMTVSAGPGISLVRATVSPLGSGRAICTPLSTGRLVATIPSSPCRP
jgi:2-oxoglutarate ferredoxin oxidoreductase subunit alpha